MTPAEEQVFRDEAFAATFDLGGLVKARLVAAGIPPHSVAVAVLKLREAVVLAAQLVVAPVAPELQQRRAGDGES